MIQRKIEFKYLFYIRRSYTRDSLHKRFQYNEFPYKEILNIAENKYYVQKLKICTALYCTYHSDIIC